MNANEMVQYLRNSLYDSDQDDGDHDFSMKLKMSKGFVKIDIMRCSDGIVNIGAHHHHQCQNG